MDLLHTFDEVIQGETDVVAQDAAPAAEMIEALGIPELPPIQQHVEYNVGETNLVKVVVLEALRRSKLEPGFLTEVRRTFAEPGKKFDSAFSTLRSDQRLVVLRASPDSGTRTAAVAMIDRLAKGQCVQPHYLRVGGPTGLPTAALAAEKYQAYLMDLTVHGEESDLSPDFGLELKAVSTVLKSAGSFLIVITDATEWDRIGRYAPGVLVHDLQPPRPELVALKWLKYRVPEHDFVDWFADPQIARLLDAATPREAVEIAKLMRTAVSPDFTPSPDTVGSASDTSTEKTDLQLRVESVVATRGQWRPQLLKWHMTPGRTAFERNFLLANAVLRGFPVGAAYREAKRLCGAFGDEAEHVRGHGGPGVIELLNTIRADTAGDGSVRFPRPRWAEAVLDYYWLDRPDDHDAFIGWLLSLPRSDTFAPQVRATVAARVSEVMFDLIVTPERMGQLGHVIDLWSAQKESMPVAWSFLDAASLHPKLGRDVAQMMLRWSKAQDVQRRRAVAAVCGSDFGRLSTDKALVRLSHLIDSGEPEVVAEAERAVIALWTQPAIGRELLEKLVAWESDGLPNRIRAARGIFTKIAALPSPTDPDRPDLLARATADEEILNLVATGWRCLLDAEMASEDLMAALRPWFEAAGRAPGIAADVVSVLGRATADGRRAHGRLEKSVYLWLGSTGVADESPAGRFVRQVERLAERGSDVGIPTSPSEEVRAG
ncbi:hypothetical protein ABH926_007204 [Catenulispora sp. GP43]|uniref:hypothetical protein n=1 Tax=Catenulispora sp. GP43 TaxID=3156263 RepID=UPI00351268AA